MLSTRNCDYITWWTEDIVHCFLQKDILQWFVGMLQQIFVTVMLGSTRRTFKITFKLLQDCWIELPMRKWFFHDVGNFVVIEDPLNDLGRHIFNDISSFVCSRWASWHIWVLQFWDKSRQVEGCSLCFTTKFKNRIRWKQDKPSYWLRQISYA